MVSIAVSIVFVVAVFWGPDPHRSAGAGEAFEGAESATEKPWKYTLRQMINYGVDVRLGTVIMEVTEHQVLLKDCTSIPADLMIRAAGATGHPDIAESTAAWRLRTGNGGRIMARLKESMMDS